MIKFHYFRRMNNNTGKIEVPSVSVIIPVYNTAPYLRKTLYSITQQTLRTIEIIIINDGSTDESLSIIRELAARDNRIKIFTQANQGLSVTRNTGIKAACGEFIYFMDSDDLLDANALEQCYLKCKEQKLDFVFFNAQCFSDVNIELRKYQYQRTQKIEDKVWNGKELLKYQDETWTYRSSACLTFTRTEFLKRNHITFYPHILHEDELYTALLYLKATRVGYIDKAFFKRRIREHSITTNQFSRQNIKGYFTTVDELTRYTLQDEDTQLLIQEHLFQMLNAAIRHAAYLPFKDRWQIFYQCITQYPNLVNNKTLGILLLKSFIK